MTNFKNDLINAPSIFRLASNISKHSEHRRCKVGAVLVANGHPISVGYNKVRSHPEAPFTGLHAEISALKSSGKKFIKGSSIFVFRRKRNGRVGIARPCHHCMKQLKEFGIRWVYYSTNEYPFWSVEKI